MHINSGHTHDEGKTESMGKHGKQRRGGGKGKGKGRGRGRGGGGGGRGGGRGRGKDTHEPWVLENKLFEAYYKAQGCVPEPEWDQFLAILKESLPATFRISSVCSYAEDLKAQLAKMEAGFNAGETITVDGKKVQPIHQVPWYPERNAYQLGFDRRKLRKMASLEALHKWVVAQVRRCACLPAPRLPSHIRPPAPTRPLSCSPCCSYSRRQCRRDR